VKNTVRHNKIPGFEAKSSEKKDNGEKNERPYTIFNNVSISKNRNLHEVIIQAITIGIKQEVNNELLE
jgi:hypothetical protein